MQINGIPINPGALRTPVYFGDPTVTQGSGGAQVRAFEARETATKVRWKNAFGNEAYTADAAGARKVATILARYDSTLDETCGVQKGGEWYEIFGGIDNIEERGEYMEFKVRLFVSS